MFVNYALSYNTYIKTKYDIKYPPMLPATTSVPLGSTMVPTKFSSKTKERSRINSISTRCTNLNLHGLYLVDIVVATSYLFIRITNFFSYDFNLNNYKHNFKSTPIVSTIEECLEVLWIEHCLAFRKM